MNINEKKLKSMTERLNAEFLMTLTKIKKDLNLNNEEQVSLTASFIANYTKFIVDFLRENNWDASLQNFKKRIRQIINEL